MSILDANADSLRATALNSYAGPSKPPEPGVFSNFLPGAGSYFMRGMAESGRALSMAGAAVPVLADKLIGSDNRGESFGDRYFRWHDETFNRAVDHWTPKPGEVGAAGQVVGSLAAGLTQFLANPALLIGTAQLSTAEDLVRQGVDAGAANVAGDVAGLSTLAGIALPIFGKTLAGRIATGAAGNFATNIPEAAIKRAVVESAGSPAAAAQFDPWDVRARTVDVLMGVAFGAKSHFDARAAAKTQAFLEGGIPSQRTAIADAAARAVESPLTATQRDAIMVMNAARHLDEAALPWRAGEAEHTAAVDNVRLAVEQISAGRAVDVPAIRPETIAQFADRAGYEIGGVSHLNGIVADLQRTYIERGAADGRAKLEDMAARAPESSGFSIEVATKGFIDELDAELASRAAQFNRATLRPDLAQSIADAAPKSAAPVAAPEMRGDRPQVAHLVTGQDGKITLVRDVPEVAVAEKDAYRKSLAAGDVPAALDALSRIRAAEGRTVSAQDKWVVESMAQGKETQLFPEDLRVPSGEFDPTTGAPKTISANEYVAKATAEAEQVKSTAEGLMRTVATCILGGI